MEFNKVKKETLTVEETMAKYPRLTAHLICQSLGYFTPSAAARAIQAHKLHQPYHCEWYMGIASYSGKDIKEVNAETLNRAFKHRHYHKGFMSSYEVAKRLVDETLKDSRNEPIFASWF